MVRRNFLKMHGLGNDFVIVDARAEPFIPSPDQVRFLADRRLGVGCDQLIVMEPSEQADIFMRIYNSDGSQAGACGNATRCVASLVGGEPVIETIAGLLPTRKDGAWYETDMGKIDVLDTNALIEGAGMPAVILNIGNPHAVFLTDQLDLVTTLGPQIEVHPDFPNRTNVQFVHILDTQNIRQRVWERGAGLTAASGSGACAGAVAAMVKGGCDHQLTVHMDGGELRITWRESDDHVLMHGPHALSFEGCFDL